MLVVDGSEPLVRDEPAQAPVHRTDREPVVPRLDEPRIQDRAPRREDLVQRGLDRARVKAEGRRRGLDRRAVAGPARGAGPQECPVRA